ncbi:MAG: ABC transporter ATP-binding protein/permease [Gemmataceae bacterium]|nr:ABC transporter ATP-binding protein/permease [Gemmataceae bacterium]
MERAAFARARSFLNYHPVAKWSALVAGILAGVFYVGLLVLLGLFADLAINRGEIPAFQHLSTQQRTAFQNELNDRGPLAPFNKADGEPLLDKYAPEGEAQGTGSRAGWKKFLKEAGVGEPTDETVARALGLLAALKALGVEEQKLERLTKVCLNKPGELTAAEQEMRKELLWRAHTDWHLRDAVDPAASELLRERFRKQVEQFGTEMALTRDLRDVGALSLVAGTQHRVDGALIAWLASWNSWMWSGGNLGYLFGLLIAAILIALLRTLCLYLNQYVAALATIEATTRLRRAIYHHTYRLGTLAVRALGPAEAISASTRHLEAVHEALYAWLTVVFREPVKFGLLLLFALFVNFWLGLAFLLFAVLVWLVGGQIAAYFRRRGRAASHRAAEQLTLIQESLMMMRLVKVYLMEVFNQARVERQLARLSSAQARRYRGEAIYRPLLMFMGLFAVLILLFVAGVVVLNGQLGVTSAVVLATALVSLYWPTYQWLEHRRVLRRGRDSAAALFKFLDRSGGVGQVVEAEFLPSLAKQLEFDNVTLHEPGTGRKLLNGVSLTIQAGQRVALVGPDEMDKHALVYLIPRFLDPTSGEIRIDRHNLRWVTLDSLRAQIAIVMQHNLVFNDTVANNIGCGDPAYTLPKIIEAAKLAHAHQFVQRLPQGYETPIGEMGHPLQTGEQFRIALARAILRDPALLIIEEPSAALDDNTKALLDDTFARVLPGRTTIFLPHRLSTIRNCDTIFLLYNGRIEAQGEHRELLKESDLYKHLQYLEFNEFAGMLLGPSAVTTKSD